ncbi:MAG: FAD-binding protein [Deltaproteobacteria bacterium]|nr:FAD-binding protein [Deltaproteobacteria bacterium]
MSDFAQNFSLFELFEGILKPSQYVERQAELWLRQKKGQVPLALLFPKSPLQVAQVLQRAHQKGLRLSLWPELGEKKPDLCLDLKFLSSFLAQDIQEGSFEVGSGVFLDDLEESIEFQGWQVPWSLGPWGAETLASALVNASIASRPREQVFIKGMQVAWPDAKLESFSFQSPIEVEEIRHKLQQKGGIPLSLAFQARPRAPRRHLFYQFPNLERAWIAFKELALEPGLFVKLKDPLAALIEQLWWGEDAESKLIKKLGEFLAPYLEHRMGSLVNASPWTKTLFHRLPYPVRLEVIYLEDVRPLREKVDACLQAEGARFLGAQEPGPSFRFLKAYFKFLGFENLEMRFCLSWAKALEAYPFLQERLSHEGISWGSFYSYDQGHVELRWHALLDPSKFKFFLEEISRLSQKHDWGLL